MFNWKEFKNAEFVVNCDTEEKANDFLKKCEEQGLVWTEGEKLTDNNNYDAEYQDTCYRCYGGEICYSTIYFYECRNIKIVKWEGEEIDNMENKFKIGDIVTGVNKSHWLSDGDYKITKIETNSSGQIYYGVSSIDGEYCCCQDCIWKGDDMKLSNNYNCIERNDNMVKTFTQVVTTIKKGEVWIDESRTRQLHKIYINEYGNITFEYIGVYSSKVTKYEDEEEGTVSYDLCVGATDEALYTLQKPLTLDDFEIEEEFRVKDMDGKFMKVKVFGSTMIAREADFGDISVLLYTIEDLNGSELIKIKGDK